MVSIVVVKGENMIIVRGKDAKNAFNRLQGTGQRTGKTDYQLEMEKRKKEVNAKMEQRRRQVRHFKGAGWSTAKIAEHLGVTPQTVNTDYNAS